MKIKTKNSGYTVLISLMIIGFLMVVTSGILSLVIRESNDTMGQGIYLQSYAGAESAMELALLKIKKHGYGVYDKKNDLDILKTSKSKITISYDLNSRTTSYNGKLSSFEQVIIPLFYLSGSIENKISDISLKITNSLDFRDPTKMAWNIVSKNGDGIGGNSQIGNYSKGNGKNSSGDFIGNIYVNGDNSSSFLGKYNKNYLILINLDPNYHLDFSLSSSKPFTKPISNIISSASNGKYKQNLETLLDNTEFLSILKYSVFSK